MGSSGEANGRDFFRRQRTEIWWEAKGQDLAEGDGRDFGGGKGPGFLSEAQRRHTGLGCLGGAKGRDFGGATSA